MKLEQNKLLRKELYFRVKSIEEDKFIIRGIFSTGGEDRHGEIIDQNGWQIKEYMENPVILFAHDQYTPSVGQCIELEKDGSGNLVGAIQFAVEEHELSKTLFGLYKNGFMRAFSVGFENVVSEYDQENDVLILKENKLYEISCVNVPANATALAYSKGIDIEPLKKMEVEIKQRIKEQTDKELNLTDESVEKLSKEISEKIQKQISADKTTNNIQVETPKSQGGRYSARDINKAVRQLLKKKHTL